MKSNSKELKGIALYNIEKDGCLNGVFTNNLIPNAEIFNETCKFIERIEEGNTIVQTYDCFYFDFIDRRNNCVLTFRINNGLYNAVWRDMDDEPIFEGEGFLMNDTQIAISYWEADQTV